MVGAGDKKNPSLLGELLVRSSLRRLGKGQDARHCEPGEEQEMVGVPWVI